MHWFLGNLESGLLNVEAHWLALAIAKKTLDDNCFRTAQKTMDREPPSFKIGNRVYFKNKQSGKWDLKCRLGYRIVLIDCDRHYLHTENQATGKIRSCNIKGIVLEPPVEFWNIDTQFGRAGKYINHPANLPTIMLNIWRWTPYSCKLSPINNLYSSSLQPIVLGYTRCNSPIGELGVCTIPTSIESLPTHHSWIITAHISLGNLNKQWRILLSRWEEHNYWTPYSRNLWFQVIWYQHCKQNLTDLDSIYTSYKSLILTATQLLRMEPTFDGVSPFNRHTRRSLLPLLGDALSWLMEMATTKDVSSIKNRVSQLLAIQHKQQETLVHIISVLNVTRCAVQVNRQHINLVMNSVERTHQDITILYNITSSLYTSVNYQQVVLHICSILANLRDFLHYMRQVTIHGMDYIDAATTAILSPHVLPVEDLQKMLIHIEEALPSTMHFPVSSEDTLHFYRCLCTHILITDKQFLLLIDVPIQDSTQQLEIYEVFNLAIPHGNLSAHYNIDSKYLGISYDETKAVEIQNSSSVHVNRLTDSFAALIHLFNHLPIHHHVSQLYTQRTKQELRKYAHYRSGRPIQPSPYQ